MPMRVVTFCTYLTNTDYPWRNDDYNASDFVNALKNKDIRGNYAYCRVRGVWHRFNDGDRENAVGWFGQMATDFLREHGPPPPFALVPIPGSKTSVTFTGTNRTTTLAQAIANEYGPGVAVRDVLRFNQPMRSASGEGGPRDAETIYANLALTGRIAGERIVLVDDVCTSGGHLAGCAAKLLIDGRASEVLLAVCGGRADRIQVPDPFAIRIEEIPDLVPE